MAALFAAASSGEVETLESLVKGGADLDYVAPAVGKTAMHFAAEKGQLATVQWLAQAGASKEKLDHLGQTPLYMAVVGHRMSVVHYLFEQGCDVDTPDNAGMTPLHAAAKLGRLGTVQFLCEEGSADKDQPANGGTLFAPHLIASSRVPPVYRLLFCSSQAARRCCLRRRTATWTWSSTWWPRAPRSTR